MPPVNGGVAIIVMDFPVALIYLMLSITADSIHANIHCKPTLCNCHLNNVKVLEQLIDLRIQAALTNIPGIAILIFIILHCLLYAPIAFVILSIPFSLSD